jgi:toxin ParE1/3/4
MIRKVEWTSIARAEFRGQIAYLAKREPTASKLVSERLRAAVAGLREFQTGRPGRFSGTFELYVPKTSLLLVYAVETDGSVRILRVIHTSRDFRPGVWPRSN